jgi:adenine C2-methylase RlmN of 23S rRNA A2503 and tRNA A37
MKREDQQDATIRCLLLTSVSTCFGHHYAHLQENKGPVTALGALFWFCWMWLVTVVGRCLVGCEHYEGFCSTGTEYFKRGIYSPFFFLKMQFVS